MTDAVALLAISQLVCLAGLAYLYSQIQKLRQGAPRPRMDRSSVAPHEELRPAPAPAPRPSATRAAQNAYGRAAQAHAQPRSAAALAAQLGEMGVDIPALARRMNRSEEEVRLLLRRQGVAR